MQTLLDIACLVAVVAFNVVLIVAWFQSVGRRRG